MDTDQLIKLVEQQPALWDKGCMLFKDRLQKDKAWCLVAEGLYGNLSNEERQEKITTIKKRWKNIRDSYTKFTNQEKSGVAAAKKKKYVYADALTFLSNSLGKIRTSGNMEGSPSSVSESNDDLSPNEEGCMEDDANGTTSQDINGARASTSRPKLSTKSSKLTSFQERCLQKLEKKVALRQEDPDKSFLMSVLPDMQKLDDAAKLDFKMYILKYFSPPSPTARTFYRPHLPFPNPNNRTDRYPQPPPSAPSVGFTTISSTNTKYFKKH